MEHDIAIRDHVAARYLLGELSEPDRNAFEEHFFGCEACAREVKSGAILAANARAVFEEDALKQAVPQAKGVDWRSWFRMPSLVPSAATAALAAVVVFQSAVTIPGLKRASEPQLAPMVTLAPATRGADQVVKLSAGARSVQLTFDVDTALTFSTYECTVKDASGKAVAAMTTPATGAATLALMLPAGQFADGEYTVELSGVNAQGKTPIESYRFRLTR